ncbi:asparagine synthase [Xylariaceae sp. FL0016]|nr:asparagine synthase [Xylariaceae sp. FL0016]
MCGISVELSLKRDSTVNRHTTGNDEQEMLADAHAGGLTNGASLRIKLEKRLLSSLDIISHRGPDARGIWVSPESTVGLAHCRLSINDLSSDGAQPLHDDEGHIHAVVNGEVYDHDLIRDQLSHEFGYRFKGHSDSEVVVALYKHYGAPAFLEQMRGEFSLVIYDDRSGEVIAVRDRFGIKPLFWTVVQDKLLIAAEIKAFLPMGWKPEWDLESVARSDCYNGTRTIFQGVQKVEPGHYMVLSPKGTIRHHQYWDLQYADKYKVETRSVDEMVSEIREKLIESIRLRLRADVPVGIYLSGGIDSSAVAGIVKYLVEQEGEKMGSQGITERIACFCIAFDKKSGYDESEIAQRTADFLGVHMHTKNMDEAELAKHFEDAVWHNEHQTFDLNTVGKFALSEVPRKHGFKVILSGEGADELFAGYPWFPSDFLLEPDYSSPELYLQKHDEIRRQLHERTLSDFQGSLIGLESGVDSLYIDPDLAKRLNHVFTPAMFSIQTMGADVYAQPLREKYNSMEKLRAKIESWSAEAQENIKHKWHPLHTALYTWNKSHLANFILTCLGDRCEMAHSIEGRPPFLDHHLAELVGTMPPSVKMHYGIDASGPQTGSSRWWNQAEDAGASKFWEKWILREAAKPFITEELYRRRKHPYSAPLSWPKGGPLHRLFTRILSKENVEAVGFLDWAVIQESLNKGFGDEANAAAMRRCQVAGSFVTISQRFGVAKAQIESCTGATI